MKGRNGESAREGGGEERIGETARGRDGEGSWFDSLRFTPVYSGLLQLAPGAIGARSKDQETKRPRELGSSGCRAWLDWRGWFRGVARGGIRFVDILFLPYFTLFWLIHLMDLCEGVCCDG